MKRFLILEDFRIQAHLYRTFTIRGSLSPLSNAYITGKDGELIKLNEDQILMEDDEKIYIHADIFVIPLPKKLIHTF